MLGEVKFDFAQKGQQWFSPLIPHPALNGTLSQADPGRPCTVPPERTRHGERGLFPGLLGGFLHAGQCFLNGRKATKSQVTADTVLPGGAVM